MNRISNPPSAGMSQQIEMSEQAVSAKACRVFKEINLVGLFFTDEMKSGERLEILKRVTAIAVEEKESVIKTAHPFITEKMQSNERAQIIRAVTNVAADDRQSVIERAHTLITEEMNGYDRAEIISALAIVPAGGRASVVEKVLSFTATSSEGRSALIETIANVPAEDWEDIVEKARTLITKVMNYVEQADIINAIKEVPAYDRLSVVANARVLMTEEMDGSDGVSILAAIAGISARDRVSVVDQAGTLIVDGMSGYEQGEILSAIANLAANDRRNVIHYARHLIKRTMWVDDRIKKIQTIAALPAAARAQYVVVHRRGLVVDYEEGVDVHDGDRDAKTKEAITLLRAHQGEMGNNRIESAKDEFIEYVQAANNELALCALLNPKKEGEQFGPLLDGIAFTIRGLEVDGVEIAGRLWIYASETEEEINAKQGMIGALARSYEQGRRVCNQGKAQRLVIAVLNGRLEGVEIEDYGLTIADAMNMFFFIPANESENRPANRDIRELKALIQAANTFCAENPDVDQTEFMKAIRTYAQQEGIV